MSGAAFGLPAQASPDTCPCGSGRAYAVCCRPLHLGQRQAGTAEELMRSRYAAFAVGDGAYLVESWHPLHRPDDLRLDPDREWTGLTVVATLAGGPDDGRGVVEYRARSRSRAGGPAGELHEVSHFERFAGRWVYTEGEFPQD